MSALDQDVLGQFFGKSKDGKLPHTYDYPAVEGKITCKFCSNKIPFPMTPEQWENALWGSGDDLEGIGRFMKFGCIERMGAKS